MLSCLGFTGYIFLRSLPNIRLRISDCPTEPSFSDAPIAATLLGFSILSIGGNSSRTCTIFVFRRGWLIFYAHWRRISILSILSAQPYLRWVVSRAQPVIQERHTQRPLRS